MEKQVEDWNVTGANERTKGQSGREMRQKWWRFLRMEASLSGHMQIITVKKNRTESLHQPPVGTWVYFSMSSTPACEYPPFTSYHNHRIRISLGFKQPLSIKIIVRETEMLPMFKCPFVAKQQLGSKLSKENLQWVAISGLHWTTPSLPVCLMSASCGSINFSKLTIWIIQRPDYDHDSLTYMGSAHHVQK